jgi:hypothetical protein
MRYLGNINFRLSIINLLKKNLKELKTQLELKCIKKLKQTKETLKKPEAAKEKISGLKEKIQKSETRLEQLKRIKTSEIKLASIIILCLHLG